MFYRVREGCTFVNAVGTVFRAGEQVMVSQSELRQNLHALEPVDLAPDLSQALESPIGVDASSDGDDEAAAPTDEDAAGDDSGE